MTDRYRSAVLSNQSLNRSSPRAAACRFPVRSMSGSCHREESIGSSVKETKRETSTAKVTVIPNWKKKRPTIPFMNATGPKTATMDDGGPPGVEEAEDDQDREDPPQHQGLLDVADGVPDHDRGVADHFDPGPRGKLFLEFPDLPLDRVHHVHGVGARLLLDVERNGGDPGHPGERPLLLDSVPGG